MRTLSRCKIIGDIVGSFGVSTLGGPRELSGMGHWRSHNLDFVDRSLARLTEETWNDVWMDVGFELGRAIAVQSSRME